MDKHVHTLTAKLREIVDQSPNRLAMQIKQEHGYKQYTYQALYQSIQSVAIQLQKSGIKKDDKIAIILENSPEWGIIYFGILFAGAIAVPLDPQSTRSDIDFYFENSESKAVITSKNFLTLIGDSEQTSKSDLRMISDILFHPLQDIVSNNSSKQSLYEPSPNDIASILYTSGTTGKPKGVILTQSNFYANFRSIEQLHILSDKHNVLSILPLHHSFPFMVNLIIPLFARSITTYVSSLKRETLLECMRETGITVLVGVPQIFYMFYRYILDEIEQTSFFIRLPLLGLIKLGGIIRKYLKINLNKLILSKIHRTFGKHLKFFVSGGAKLDESAAKFLMKIGFTIIEGYGLTETAPVVTFNPLHNTRIGSAGKLIPEIQLKIVEPNQKGIGEIAIYGPNIMQGYYKRPADTAEVLKNGWFHSGDLGYIDEEGFLFITGRKKELIILSSGKNISPEAVESYYVKSPYIKELCVLTVGEKTEEKLVAVIVPDFDYFRGKGITTNIYHSIKWNLETLSRNYSTYKRIMGFIITKQELPRTRLGKLKRFEIRDQYLDELIGEKTTKPEEIISLSEEDLKMLASEMWDKVIEILKETFHITKTVTLNDHLELDLGIDSLSRVELITELEKELNTRIPETTMVRISTMRELMYELEQQVPERKLLKEKPLPSRKVSIWKELLIDTAPTEKLIQKVATSASTMANIITIISYKLLYIIFKIFWRIKIIGTENLPKEEAFILCSNHTSYLDGFLIAAALPLWLTKKLFFLGFRYYFELPIIRTLVKVFKIIPIDPNTQLIDAMQACAYVLQKKYVMCIFPEGERSINGEIKKFRSGIGILAKELNVKLVPVFIKGAYESWPRGQRFPKLHPITIIFGEPHQAKELQEKGLKLGAKNDYEAIALGTREEVEKKRSNVNL